MQSKNQKIKQTLMETRQKRINQKCFVRELKIHVSKLSKSEQEKLKMMFVQAKWLYNYILGLEDSFSFDDKTKTIYSIDKNGNKVERTLTLPARIVQSISKELKQNILTLSKRKKKGIKIGKLKFKSEYNSIDLPQYGVTHKLVNNHIKICGIKKHLKVFGLEQILPSFEIANAKLIQKPSGYYINLTCFENLTFKNFKTNQVKNEVGLDFGIKTHITTSDNEKFNVIVEESERLKNLQKKLLRQNKSSNNYNKTRLKIRKEYEKLSNLKKDKTNKIVHYLCSKYNIIYMQDELIKLWHKGLFGKQVQWSILGKLKRKLKEQPNVIIIDSFYPTTKLCYNCGTLHKNITLNDRTFVCPTCGFTEERDLKAAKTILFIGQCKNSYAVTEHNSTTVEKMSDFLNSYENKKQSSMK